MADKYIFPEEKYILLGRIMKAHGLKGELKILPFSGQPENFKDYSHLNLISLGGEISTPFKIVSCRQQGKFAVVGLNSIENRNQSEQIVGMGILLERDQLPQSEEEQYYWDQLVGQKVILFDSEKVIGIVTSIFSGGAHDILVVTNKGQELLIPFTDSIVIEIDKQGIVINPPPGLLEINSGVDDLKG